MTVSLEFKAKNVEKAIEKASKELNMPKREIKYEVLSYGSSGIFGLSGAKKAKIRIQQPVESAPEISEPASIPSDGIEDSEPSDAFNPDADDAAADQENLEGGRADSFLEDPVDMGRNVLQRIIDAITKDAQISVEKDSERIFFNVNGGNAGVLIGKQGKKLADIQCIVV